MQERGFTLIEVLVALGLFALLASLGYGGLERVMAARTALEAENRRWQDLEAFFNLIQQDLLHSIARPVRDSFGITEPAWLGKSVIVHPDDAQFYLVRSRPRQPPQRIAYRWHESRLERLTWPMLDLPPRATPTREILLQPVEHLRWRFMDAQASWQDNWPIGNVLAGAPRAIEIEIQLAGTPRLKRVLLAP